MAGTSGALGTWSYASGIPWHRYRDKITSAKFGEGVKAQTCYRMFEERKNLASIDLTGLDTSPADSMYCMFADCCSLTSLDLSAFDTAAVTDMNCMFANCVKLKAVYASKKWGTRKVESSDSMFYECVSLRGGNGTAFDANQIDASRRNENLNLETTYHLTAA